MEEDIQKVTADKEKKITIQGITTGEIRRVNKDAPELYNDGWKILETRITSLPQDHIFVFGSNRLGLHRRGAAKDAMDYFNAIYKQGEGLQGQCYALPTKRTPYASLTLAEIQSHIDIFGYFAISNPHLTFHVTPIGTGLANYTIEDIAPLFAKYSLLLNVILPKEFVEVIQKTLSLRDRMKIPTMILMHKGFVLKINHMEIEFKIVGTNKMGRMILSQDFLNQFSSNEEAIQFALNNDMYTIE